MAMLDKIKLLLAGFWVAAGVIGFYMIPASQNVWRLLLVLLGWVLALLFVGLSQPGRQFISYARDALAEGRKVVWPTRKEALQVTGLVFLFVTILALFMWLVDTGLSWLIYGVILGRGW